MYYTDSVSSAFKNPKAFALGFQENQKRMFTEIQIVDYRILQNFNLLQTTLYITKVVLKKHIVIIS